MVMLFDANYDVRCVIRNRNKSTPITTFTTTPLTLETSSRLAKVETIAIFYYPAKQLIAIYTCNVYERGCMSSDELCEGEGG